MSCSRNSVYILVLLFKQHSAYNKHKDSLYFVLLGYVRFSLIHVTDLPMLLTVVWLPRKLYSGSENMCEMDLMSSYKNTQQNVNRVSTDA